MTTALNPLEHQLVRQRETAKDFFWHRLRWRVLKSFVEGAEPKAFLDVGAGSGLFSKFVKRDFPSARYCFVEPSKALAGLVGVFVGGVG